MKKIIIAFLLLLSFTFSKAQIVIEHLDNNTKFADFNANFYKNKLIYVSSRYNEERKRVNVKKTGTLYLTSYLGTYRKNGKIIKDELFSNITNEDIFLNDIAFTPDNKTVYFTKASYYNGVFVLDSLKKRNKKIFKATIGKGNKWSNIQEIPFNSDVYSVQNPQISQDGTKLLFSSNKNDTFGSYDLYMATINPDGTYGEAINLGANINTEKREMYPFLTKNNILYFASDGHKGKGGLDIYKAKLNDDNTFSEVKALKGDFNSKRDDFAYITDQKGRFGYFSSTRKGGKGDVDIYTYTIACNQKIEGIIEDEKNQQPIANATVELLEDNSLHKVIKTITTKTNGSYQFDLDCNTHYLIKVTKHEYTNNTYKFTTNDNSNNNLEKDITLKPMSCNQVVSGKILDKKTLKTITGATAVLTVEGKEVDRIKSDVDGSYFFELKCDSTYKILASKENYAESESLITTNTYDAKEIVKDISLESMVCYQTLKGKVIDKKTLKEISNAVVKLVKEGKELNSVLTDNTGFYTFKVKCDDSYILFSSSLGYLDKTVEVKTTSEDSKELVVDITLEDPQEFVEEKGVKKIITNPIHFDFDAYKIVREAAIELDKVVDIMKKHPTIKIELTSHTDSRGPDKYNMILSKNRAKSSKNYLVRHGISADRITSVGYGETKPVNHCTNGVKCTNEEYLLNRRTEFIVIDE